MLAPYLLGRRGPGAYGSSQDGGFEEQPVVTTTSTGDTTIKGKVKPGSFGKFVVPLATVQAGRQYTFRYTPQFAQLAQQGKLAMVGFGFKTNNDFHIAGLRGDGSTGLHKYQVYGTPPNGWNAQTGHTVNDGGAAASGTQAGPNYLRLTTGLDGSIYKLQSSTDGSTWNTEFTGQTPSPFSNISGVTTFGVALWFNNADAGPFSITIDQFADVVAPFSPLDLPTLNRWFDPSDNATLTLISSLVDVMADKSGNARDINAPTSTRRVALSTINSVQCLNHSGSTYLSRSGGFGAINGNDTPFTWFEVCQPANTTQAARFHACILNNIANTPIRALMQDSTLGVGMRARDNANVVKDATVTGQLDTTPQIFSLVCHGTTVDLRRNGVSIISGGDVDVGTTGASHFALGAQYNGVSNSNFYVGKMGECALCETDVSSVYVSAMEAYLAAKWGITI